MGLICIPKVALLLQKNILSVNTLQGKILHCRIYNQCGVANFPTRVKSNTRPRPTGPFACDNSKISTASTGFCNGTRLAVARPCNFSPKLMCSDVQRRFFATELGTAAPATSSAWQIGQYGKDVLTLTETRTPTVTKPHEVLIQVFAASVNPIDVKTRDGYGASLLNKARRVKPGDEFPLTLGRDCSGEVIDIGKGVKDFKIGDNVWASVNAVKQGCHAEYVICGMEELSKKPRNLSHVEAASIPYVAITNWSAAYAVAKFRPQTALGKRALIFGGSGGIGTFGVQLLNAWGANVTVTCSADAFDLMRQLGAHQVVDYKSSNILQELLERGKYDFILNAASEGVEDLAVQVMKEKAYAQYVTLFTPFLNEMDEKGALVGALSSSLMLLKKSRKFAAVGGKFRWAFAQPNGFALKEVAKLVEEGKIKPVIDEVFDYQDLPQAFQKVESRHTRGKVVVDVAGKSGEDLETTRPPELFQ